MAQVLPSGLVDFLLNELDITWEDPGQRTKVENWAQDGMAKLNRIGGAPQAYTAPGAARRLLVDYCRYARDSALDAFETDYRHELLALQIDGEVAHAQL